MIQKSKFYAGMATPRLNLRLVEMSDLDSIHTLHSMEETDKYNTLGIPKNINETNDILAKWINDSKKAELPKFVFVIELIDSKSFVGLIGINVGSEKFRIAEVWYKLDSKYWGNGYASEALNAIIQYGFDQLNLHRIEAGCAVENIGSIKVLEKVGMQREGRKRQVLPLKTGWSDNYIYAILDIDVNTTNY